MRLVLTDKEIQNLNLTEYFPHILPDTFFTRMIRKCNELGLKDKKLIYVIHIKSPDQNKLIINLGYEDNILDIDDIEVFSADIIEIQNTDNETLEWSSSLTDIYLNDFLMECNKQGLKGFEIEDIFGIMAPPFHSQRYMDFTLKGKSKVGNKISA